VNAGATATTLTVTGTGFIASTAIQVGGVTESTTYVSSTQVTAIVPASQIAIGGQLSVIAVNGALSSTAVTNLQVTNPAPTINSLSPNTALAGATSPLVAVTGTGFVPTTTIQVNGNARTTTYVSATQVNVALTTADVAGAGTLSLTAVNAAPGGGTSTAASIAVSNPVPSLTAISPGYVIAGSAASTVTVAGSGFVAASAVTVNGTAMPTTFVSASQLTFSIASPAVPQVVAIAVSNPIPGGGISGTKNFAVLAQTPAPVITQVSPAQFSAGSAATTIAVYGSNFGQQVAPSTYYITGSVLWNGAPLTYSGFSAGTPQALYAAVPANLIASVSTASITVSSFAASPATSNAVTVNIVPPPPPTLTSINPAAGPINTAASVTLYGSGFTSGSTVALNGTTIPSKLVSSSQMTVTIPASNLMLPANYNLTVATPTPGGGTTSALPFTAYIGISNNDIVFNASDGLLYASVPGTVAGIGNSVVGIDLPTGNVVRQIWVGSNPNKLALSTDGTQLFVGLDGAGAVVQVNLTTGLLVKQFWLGGGPGVYNPPLTATYMAGVPGSPNSVAVSTGSSIYSAPGVTIYDSGVARSRTSSTAGYTGGPIAFGPSSATLYVLSSSGLAALNVDSTGIASASLLNNSISNPTYLSTLQYDSGSLYLSNGVVINASTGTLVGTFYATTSSPVSGPVVSDSTLGLAFAGQSSYTTSGTSVIAFSESTFDPTGSIPFAGGTSSGSPLSLKRIVRWGQNGIALNTATQIFVFQSPVVKDLSPSPADLSVTLTAPQTATTGTAISYVATVKNLGPNQAQNAILSLALDSSLIINSVTASQGSCSTGYSPTCDVGNLANGSSATLTVNAVPTTASTLSASAVVNSASYDPASTNNQAVASTMVTGSFYAMAPALTSISPNLVQAGSGTFTLTVNGSGFNSASTVNINGSAQTTTYLTPTQITASVDASLIQNLGWAPVTVSNGSPGGGTSQIVPLTIYAIANVPANAIVFDPFTQKIYASVPSAATSLTGNSIVAIDPATASVGTPVVVGSEPNAIAETSDGNYLFAALTGSNSLAQFGLPQQSLVATIPVNLTQGGSTSSTTPTSVAAMPGTDTTLAIGISNGWGNFGIFDISGSTGTFRPSLSGIYEGVKPVFADPTHLYAYDSQTSGAEFYRYSVDPNGLTVLDGTTLNGMGGYGGNIQIAGGLAYGAGGGIVNPSTTPPSQVAVLPAVDVTGTGNLSYYTAGPLADPSLKKDFLILQNGSPYYLVRYDGSQYLPESWLAIPTQSYTTSSFMNMLRWGQDGIALLESAQSSSSNQTVKNVLLLRGPFVAPQLLGTSSAATLTSSSATTVSHGAGNTLLTLTGANFLPGVAVTWNGSYRTTTIVDSSHVTVAIPASDFANAGSASLAALNAGASASNALTITIN
jgi:sugar lactone lactonase YvrE